MVGCLTNPVEILGNRTVDATLVLMRALYEMGGTFTFEHALRFKCWSLKALQSMMGLGGVTRTHIDQCMFGLKPCDQPSSRYLRLTSNLSCGPVAFVGRSCNGQHTHVKIESGYRGLDGKTVRRSSEAGTYPRVLA